MIGTTKIRFCSLYDGDYSGSMISLLRKAGMKSLNLEDISAANLIVFNGGSDIGTSIYGEKPIHSGIPYSPSSRDKSEIALYEQYEMRPVLKVGICRGAQLLNCLNGGTLWQDVNHHSTDHQMLVVAGDRIHEIIPITSTHHQMMRPNLIKGKILAIADQSTRKWAYADRWHSSDNSAIVFPDHHKDTEIVYYPETHSLCIQGHPEYVPGSIFANYCIDLIHKYIPEVYDCVA